MIDWLFEIDTLKLSTKPCTYGGNTYTQAIIPDSFSGVNLRWSVAGNGLIAPSNITFDVSNVAGTYTTADFQDESVTIRIIEDSVQIRVWKMQIDRAIECYGKITCYAVSFLQKYLAGDYPNTPAPSEVWSDSAPNPDETYRIPVTLGTAYVPVRSVNTGSARWYVLGESGPTYTVTEVMAPRGWPSDDTWGSGSYTMTGATSGGYQLLQPIIADSDGDGSADAVGLWKPSGTFLDMLCKFTRSDTSALTNPAEWIEYVLEDFGVASGDIDSTSFSAADSTYDTYSIGFDGGGWWRSEPRESVLSNLLEQVDSYLYCTDKIELYQFSATSVETITIVKEDSFSPVSVTKSQNDSGRVHWTESTSKPSDILNGQAVVPTHDSGTENYPSSEVLRCRFMPGDSINAQKAGILKFQKKYEQAQRVTFSKALTALTNKDTLRPGQVITLNNTIYGGSSDMIITDMQIHLDLTVDFTCVVLNYLEDWGDLTTTTKDVVTDSSEGERFPTTNYTGDLSPGSWDDLLDIPDRFLETASLGINVTDSYLGYYDGTTFQSYIQSNGNFQFRGDANNYINWNGTTLNVVGAISITNPATVRSDINVADGADVTASNTANDVSNVNGVSASIISGWRYGATTYINGGDIYTGTITASQIAAGTITANEISTGTLTVDEFGDLTGNIHFTSSGTITFDTSTGKIYGGGGFVELAYSTNTIRTSSSGINLTALGSGDDVTIWASDQVSINANTDDVYINSGSGHGTYIRIAGSNNYIFGAAGLYPASGVSGSRSLGDYSSYMWDEVHANAFYDNNVLLADVMDDLYEVSQFKPLKKKEIDPDTGKKIDGEKLLDKKTGLELLDLHGVNRKLTNYDKVFNDIKTGKVGICAGMMTDEEIADALADYEELGWMLRSGVTARLSLGLGAVAQLDKEMVQLFDLAMARITKLENEIRELKGRANG